jgi:hypothetical protein
MSILGVDVLFVDIAIGAANQRTNIADNITAAILIRFTFLLLPYFAIFECRRGTEKGALVKKAEFL